MNLFCLAAKRSPEDLNRVGALSDGAFRLHRLFLDLNRFDCDRYLALDAFTASLRGLDELLHLHISLLVYIMTGLL